MTDKELIEALGDTGAISALTKSKESAVSNWKKRGIPWRHKPAIARRAAEFAVPLPADFWEVKK